MTRTILFLGLAACLAASCTRTTYTARHSVNPVLLGPVTRVGGAPGEAAGTPAGPFRSRTVTFASYSSRDESRSSTHAHATNGPDGRRRVTHHTTTERTHEDSSWTHESGDSKVDWDVVLVTGGDLGRRVVLRSLTCSGWDFQSLAWYMTRASCRASGEVVAGPPPSPFQPPPAPPSAPPSPPSP